MLHVLAHSFSVLFVAACLFFALRHEPYTGDIVHLLPEKELLAKAKKASKDSSDAHEDAKEEDADEKKTPPDDTADAADDDAKHAAGDRGSITLNVVQGMCYCRGAADPEMGVWFDVSNIISPTMCQQSFGLLRSSTIRASSPFWARST